MKLNDLLSTKKANTENTAKTAPKTFKVYLCKADILKAKKALKAVLDGKASDELKLEGKAKKCALCELTYSENTAEASKAKLAFFNDKEKGALALLVFPKKKRGFSQFGYLLNNEIEKASDKAKKSHYLISRAK